MAQTYQFYWHENVLQRGENHHDDDIHSPSRGNRLCSSCVSRKTRMMLVFHRAMRESPPVTPHNWQNSSVSSTTIPRRRGSITCCTVSRLLSVLPLFWRSNFSDAMIIVTSTSSALLHLNSRDLKPYRYLKSPRGYLYISASRGGELTVVSMDHRR